MISEAVITGLISAVPAVIAAILTLLSRKNLQELHIQINSRMDQWMKSAQSASRAEGKAEGIADGRKDQSEGRAEPVLVELVTPVPVSFK